MGPGGGGGKLKGLNSYWPGIGPGGGGGKLNYSCPSIGPLGLWNGLPPGILCLSCPINGSIF